MKTSKITFLALCGAVAALSCKKADVVDKQEPWVNDESLQVPVQIMSRTSAMTTKAGEIGSLDGIEFGVYAVGESTKPQPILFQDMYEIGSNCLPSTVGADNMAVLTINGKPAYYPLSSTNNYTFYGFHVNDAEGTHTYVADDNTVQIADYGKIDVLWSEPAAATPIDDPDKGTVEGFCAKYIRSVYKLGLQSTHLPKLKFEHQTAEFIVKVKAADARAEESFKPENGNVRITDAVVKNIPSTASLNVVTGEIVEGSEFVNKTCDIAEGGIYPVQTGAEVCEFFICPDNASTLDNLEYEFTIAQAEMNNAAPNNYKVTGSQIRAKFEENPEFTGFSKGYRYILNVTISSAEKIEILVSLEPWHDGFSGDIIDIE